jgi:hypothetical protein
MLPTCEINHNASNYTFREFENIAAKDLDKIDPDDISNLNLSIIHSEIN